MKCSLPIFFERLQLQTLICEPYALNEAPSRTLKKLGFIYEKSYVCVPGPINIEQEVKRWYFTRDMLKTM